MVRQGVETLADVDVLNRDVRRGLDVDRCEVPKSSHAGETKLVGHLLGHFLRRADDADIDVVILNKFNDAFVVHDLNAVDYRADERRIHLEDPLYDKSRLVIVGVVDNGFSQIACADDDHLVFSVQTEDGADLIVQPLDAVTVALLSEPTEVVQVLTDLRSGITDQ